MARLAHLTGNTLAFGSTVIEQATPDLYTARIFYGKG